MPAWFAPFSALAHLFFPHDCCGCGSDLLPADGYFCLSCFARLPFTFFENIPGNAVEKLFTGRADIGAAMSLFYFTDASAIRKGLHRFKYKGDRKIGAQFGAWMAERIKASGRFDDCDAVIPLPLHPSRERKRGFNQAAVLGAALASGLQIPMISGNLIRGRAAGSQTKKGRLDRWKQIQESFRIRHPDRLKGMRILLVDDVVTTGATLEAASGVLLAVPGVKLSLASLAFSVPV